MKSYVYRGCCSERWPTISITANPVRARDWSDRNHPAVVVVLRSVQHSLFGKELCIYIGYFVICK